MEKTGLETPTPDHLTWNCKLFQGCWKLLQRTARRYTQSSKTLYWVYHEMCQTNKTERWWRQTCWTITIHFNTNGRNQSLELLNPAYSSNETLVKFTWGLIAIPQNWKIFNEFLWRELQNLSGALKNSQGNPPGPQQNICTKSLWWWYNYQVKVKVLPTTQDILHTLSC